MKNDLRKFSPYKRILVPILAEKEPKAALALAASLRGKVDLLGLLLVAPGAPISVEAQSATRLRLAMQKIRAAQPQRGAIRVQIAQDPLKDFIEAIRAQAPDLLILEWPQHFEALHCRVGDLQELKACSIAVVRGPWPQAAHTIVLPLRGGPNAAQALRLGMALPHQELQVLHLSAVTTPQQVVDPPFQGLQQILPKLPGVQYRRSAADVPLEGILEAAAQSDLVIMGASVRRPEAVAAPGTVVDQVLQRSNTPVVVVQARGPEPEAWTGSAGARAGAQAISVLVDRWFAENTYHADEFDDLERLVDLKQDQDVTISLALPALNEEETVGKVIRTVKTALMDRVPLLDEIVLMDSNSTDRTREIAAELGVPVYIHQQVLPEYGARAGKGEALWKSLYVTRGDIVIWIDTDIVNIHPRFVYGVIGPLLENPSLSYVKGFYQRPLRTGNKLQAGGGGRVTELTARPLINLFYPELSGIIQPLSGEYGGRRQALEQVPFFSGYGVETGMLIEVLERFGLSSIAQSNLLERIHHNQPLEALSKMSFVIIQAVLRKLESRFGRPMLEEVNKTMKLIRYRGGEYSLDVEEVTEWERPPMIELPEYRARRAAAGH